MIQPDFTSDEAITLLAQLNQVRQKSEDRGNHISVVVLADSVGMTTAFLNPEHFPAFEVDNRSVSGGRYGYYGYPFKRNDAEKIAAENIVNLHDDLLTLDHRPDFAVLFFGRNDCQTVNTINALEYVAEKATTGELELKIGYTYTWVQSIYDLLDTLKALGIIPVIVTSTPMEKVGHCEENGQHINRVFAEVARTEGIPLIIPAHTAYIMQPQRDGYVFNYDLAFGVDTFEPGFLRANSDGLHIPPNKYDNFNDLVFGSLNELSVKLGIDVQPKPTSQGQVRWQYDH